MRCITFLSILAVMIISVSGFVAKQLTMASLIDQNAIFDDFEKTESVWLYSDKIGAAAASGVERAKVAIAGPLGLSSQEAVYFIATEDNQGQRLSSSCDYRVVGPSIDTRWWSLTLYDSQTQHYVPNAINRSSWNSAAVPKSENGDWVINVSQTSTDETWLPSQEKRDQPFELILRVYNPSAETRGKLPNISLPDVVKASC